MSICAAAGTTMKPLFEWFDAGFTYETLFTGITPE